MVGFNYGLHDVRMLCSLADRPVDLSEACLADSLAKLYIAFIASELACTARFFSALLCAEPQPVYDTAYALRRKR